MLERSASMSSAARPDESEKFDELVLKREPGREPNAVELVIYRNG